MSVAFVVAGGPQRGMGHIYETVTLTDDISPREAVVVFLEGDETAVEVLHRNGIRTETFETPDTLGDRLRDHRPTTVVFDHPDLDERSLTTVQNQFPETEIVGIGNPETNLPDDAASYCDVVVNYSRDITSFTGVREHRDGCLFLEGTAYFIIGPEFVPYENSWQPSSSSVNDVLLLFGASDPSNYSARVLDRLLSVDRDYEIDVVLGPGYSHHDAFERVRDSHETRAVSVHRDVDDVCRFMRSADVLLSSPGLTTFEALYVGCPVAAICQTPAHTAVYEDVPFAFEYDEIEDIEALLEETHERFATGRGGRPEVGTRREEIVDAIVGSGTTAEE